ncbi:MAG: YraN family protein [Nitratireductor sp.]|nr:YraN family protein [Nitratireductor sp.]
MTRTDAPRKKHAALRRGASGEWLAALSLRLKGWRIVERNFRCPMGEIDVIARKGDLIAFVEVKARPTEQEALDAVTARARRRIHNAGAAWIARQRDAGRLSWRFDIVAVLPRRWPRHHPDAF